MLRVLLAGVWPYVGSLESYDVHQATKAMTPSREPGLGKVSRNLAAAKERILRKYTVDLMHQIKHCWLKANRHEIDRWTADFEPLALACQAQIGGSL
jgi:hypothetical protein